MLIPFVLSSSQTFTRWLQMEEDENGKPGVLMQTKLVKKAAEAATRTAMTRLGPRVLPMSELVSYYCRHWVKFSHCK